MCIHHFVVFWARAGQTPIGLVRLVVITTWFVNDVVVRCPRATHALPGLQNERTDTSHARGPERIYYSLGGTIDR